MTRSIATGCLQVIGSLILYRDLPWMDGWLDSWTVSETCDGPATKLKNVADKTCGVLGCSWLRAAPGSRDQLNHIPRAGGTQTPPAKA
jgi:hypothetical protein